MRLHLSLMTIVIMVFSFSIFLALNLLPEKSSYWKDYGWPFVFIRKANENFRDQPISVISRELDTAEGNVVSLGPLEISTVNYKLLALNFISGVLSLAVITIAVERIVRSRYAPASVHRDKSAEFKM